MSEDEIEAVALIIGSAIVRRFAAALRQDGASDEEAVDALALLAGGVAVPVLRTFLSEDDPIAALDQIDELERTLAE
jgi:alkylhydroperoxidase/carboxymuconolactone decarboxylase family protein YurZ